MEAQNGRMTSAQKLNGLISILITIGFLTGSVFIAGEYGLYISIILGSFWMWMDARKRDLSTLTACQHSISISMVCFRTAAVYSCISRLPDKCLRKIASNLTKPYFYLDVARSLPRF